MTRSLSHPPHLRRPPRPVQVALPLHPRPARWVSGQRTMARKKSDRHPSVLTLRLGECQYRGLLEHAGHERWLRLQAFDEANGSPSRNPSRRRRRLLQAARGRFHGQLVASRRGHDLLLMRALDLLSSVVLSLYSMISMSSTTMLSRAPLCRRVSSSATRLVSSTQSCINHPTRAPVCK